MNPPYPIPLAAVVLACFSGAITDAQPGPWGPAGQGRGFGPGGGFVPRGRLAESDTENDLLRLVQSQAVQRAIDMTDDQAAGIQNIVEQARRQATGEQPGLLSMSLEERERYTADIRARREQQTAEIQAAVADLLNSHQMQRLQQISIQRRGASALRDPEVATALGLTEAQQAEIATVDDERNVKIQSQRREWYPGGNRDSFREQMEAVRQQADEEIFAVLTAEQKTKFEELKGEPFQMAEDGAAPPAGTEPVVSGPIECGFLMVDGRYLPPPYVVKRLGNEVFVNDHLIPTGPVARPMSQPGWGGAGAGPPWQGPLGRRGWNDGNRSPFLFSWSQQGLQDDSLLIVLQDDLAGFVPAREVHNVLDVLHSDATSEQKAQTLAAAQPVPFSSTQWARIVTEFQSSLELIERIRQRKEEAARIERDHLAARRWNAIVNSASLKYGVTVAALILAATALGSLLNYRPKSDTRWSEIDQEGDRVGMVIRNVALLATLGVFDLVLTLVAQQAGGFLELNPLGTMLAGKPVYLALFKISTLFTACLILAALRRYRGAQAASWWLCLVCTILTFRWLTYNSMFLT